MEQVISWGFRATSNESSVRIGITNLIFMKPGSIVMEITSLFDARNMPYCGK